MDRLTKLIVLGSTILAFGLLVDINSQASGLLLPLCAAAFVAASIAEARLGDRTVSVVLLLLYLLPAMYLLTIGVRFRYTYASPWLAALLGCLVPRSLKSGWAIPRPFKAPLVLWALSVSAVWPILAARELDFTLALMYAPHGATSRAGVPPAVAIEWMLYVTCTTSIGLLLTDWLSAAYARSGQARFDSHVVWPLFSGAMVSALVATYQAFGHITFLNPTIYGSFGRATGTMLDSNVCGTIAALWIPVAGALLLESLRRRSWTAVLWTAALAVLGVSIFATGSRTAFLIAVVGAAFLIVRAWRSLRGQWMVTLFAAAAVAVIVAGVIVRNPTSPTGGLNRLRYVFGDGSIVAAREGLVELWRRNGYGTAATQAIVEHPLVGIGSGSFNTQAPDWIFRRSGFLVFVPDNAQNWYRHQLAELGLLGSAGWIGWTALFAWALVWRRGESGSPERIAAVKGAIIGFALASLFGMPSQEAAVWLTFIVFAFWYLRLTAPATRVAEGADASARREWTGVLTIATAFILGTAYAASHTLRPPLRALAADWHYQSGFFEYEGARKDVRWTGKRAVDVIPADKRWLKLVIGGGPPAAEPPLDVRVWRNGERILRFTARAQSLVTAYVRVPDKHRRVEGNRQVMIEIAVNRTWKPSDYGNRDDLRELGVRVDQWTFVDDPPPGAVRIE